MRPLMSSSSKRGAFKIDAYNSLFLVRVKFELDSWLTLQYPPHTKLLFPPNRRLLPRRQPANDTIYFATLFRSIFFRFFLDCVDFRRRSCSFLLLSSPTKILEVEDETTAWRPAIKIACHFLRTIFIFSY